MLYVQPGIGAAGGNGRPTASPPLKASSTGCHELLASLQSSSVPRTARARSSAPSATKKACMECSLVLAVAYSDNAILATATVSRVMMSITTKARSMANPDSEWLVDLRIIGSLPSIPDGRVGRQAKGALCALHGNADLNAFDQISVIQKYRCRHLCGPRSATARCRVEVAECQTRHGELIGVPVRG